MGRRDPRRLPLRPRRDRHEEPDGRRGRRGGAPRPRSGAKFSGTLKVISVADEETGGVLGAKWITEKRPGPLAGRLPAQRGRGRGHALRRPPPVRRLRGREGHVPLQRHAPPAPPPTPPSPGLADERAARARAADHPARRGPPRLRPDRGHPRAGARRSARTRTTRRARSSGCAAISPQLAPLLDAAMSVTFAPTIVSAGEKINVIPARAQVRVDCRVPPGMGEDVALKRAREVLGDDGYELEFTEAVVGNRSPVESPLMDAIGGWLGRARPGRRGRPDRPARLHRLPLVPRRVPGLRRLRLLPPAPPDRSTRPGR